MGLQGGAHQAERKYSLSGGKGWVKGLIAARGKQGSPKLPEKEKVNSFKFKCRGHACQIGRRVRMAPPKRASGKGRVKDSKLDERNSPDAGCRQGEGGKKGQKNWSTKGEKNVGEFCWGAPKWKKKDLKPKSRR